METTCNAHLEAVDPTNQDAGDYTNDGRFPHAVDLVFDLAKKYGVSPDEVICALQACVDEGDQR